MFGYIKPFADDLKIREFELYKSFYCGLCKTMGHASRLTLSYDLVFLALLRTALTDEKIEHKTFRCGFKPYKKRKFIKPNGSLKYSAAVSGIFNYYKCRDNVQDSKNKLKKLIFTAGSLFFLRKRNKAASDYPELSEKIKKNLCELTALERGKCASIDRAASVFAEIMRITAKSGLNGDKERIAGVIGWHLGRWLYIIDAIDDFDMDQKKREYNAFIEYYQKKDDFSADLDIIKYSLTSSLSEISAAVSLLPCSPVLPVILNIVNLGLCDVQEKILNKYKKIKPKENFS